MPTWLDKRKEFIKICQRALLLRIQVSTGGNLSLKLEETHFLVKPSGISLSDLKEEDLLVSDECGKIIEGDKKPTKELNAHLKIYKVRKDVGGIVHYHPPFATSYAVSGREIPLKTVHSKRILGKIPVIPPGKEGSVSLACLIERTFSDSTIHAALLAGHGIIAAGSDLRQAQNLAELVEETAKIAFLSQSISNFTSIASM